MDPYGVILFVAAIVVSSAALTAVVANRFRKVLAGTVVLLAGFCPWLIILGFSGWLRENVWFALGMFGSPPLYFVSFFLYGTGASTRGRGIAAVAALVGMFAAVGNTLFLFHLFSKME